MADIDEAHKEEIRMAIEKNNVDPDGMPYITVVLDGGWSKRSYGHNYNALSGVVSTVKKKHILFLIIISQILNTVKNR